MLTASLADRISIALAELRRARADEDLSRELSWTRMLDRLLERYSAELKREAT